MSQSKRRPQTAKQSQPVSLPILAAAAVMVIAGVAILLLLNRPQAAASPTGFPAQLSVNEAVTLREQGAFILDVRQPEEWNDFHVPDSTLIPLGELESRLSEVPRDRDIVVVCRSGNRSQQGRDILLKAGFQNVTSMAGGLREWQALGYPTITGP